jgi:hypothetical protein
MIYLALDQNKWSELDRARCSPKDFPAHYEVLCRLSEAVAKGKITIPLVQSNLLETARISDIQSRRQRVSLMNTLSGGKFVFGPDYRRRIEVSRILARYFAEPWRDLPSEWFITTRFWEATSVYSEKVPESVAALVDLAPEWALYDYLCDLEASILREAMHKFDTSGQKVLDELEERRVRWIGESASLRRKAHGVLIFMRVQDEIWAAVDAMKIPSVAFKNAGVSLMRDIVREVPMHVVERELMLVLERENRQVTQNDLRDVSFFTATIPHMDIIVAEKGFIDRSRQAGLAREFPVKLLTELSDLSDHLTDLQ